MELMTKVQVCELLQVCERTIENMVNAKSFPPPLRLGKTSRWARSVVESWLALRLRPQLEWEPRGYGKRLSGLRKG